MSAPQTHSFYGVFLQNSESEIYALPTATKSDADPRRVGIEFEFGGMELDRVAKIVTDTLGGELGEKNAAEQSVEIAALGTFNIEVDWDLLKRLSDNKDVPQFLTQALSDSATVIVPIEIVCPPILPQQLKKLDHLVDKLREAGAQGTEHSWVNAFGLHINVELPDCEAATLDRYLKAYALLQDWLVAQSAVDLSRRITPYIDLFPEEYLVQVLRRSEPELTDIFEDYLQHNLTRNRALDLLPLLAHIDEDRVRARIDDNRIKPRPAFHYRLPDCRLDDPDWSLAEPWELWCAVERLADNKELLEKVVERALIEEAGRPALLNKGWGERVSEWLPPSA